jgi:hypothetical protein
VVCNGSSGTGKCVMQETGLTSVLKNDCYGVAFAAKMDSGT